LTAAKVIENPASFHLASSILKERKKEMVHQIANSMEEYGTIIPVAAKKMTHSTLQKTLQPATVPVYDYEIHKLERTDL
jgi:hypothetical protein